MFVCFACPLSLFRLFILPCLLAFLFGLLLRDPFQGSFQGSFYGAPFRGSFYGAPLNVTVPRLTFFFYFEWFFNQANGL